MNLVYFYNKRETVLLYTNKMQGAYEKKFIAEAIRKKINMKL